jgi:hypothetical protein
LYTSAAASNRLSQEKLLANTALTSLFFLPFMSTPRKPNIKHQGGILFFKNGVGHGLASRTAYQTIRYASKEYSICINYLLGVLIDIPAGNSFAVSNDNVEILEFKSRYGVEGDI